MDFRDSNQNSNGAKYVSKRVMINGQFVTLYSANGQTWVSSPEEIPALMERLDNARVSLNTAERVAEGEGVKTAEPEPKDKKEGQPVPERILSTKYRVKGPKPRPILNQDGTIIKGTPIQPISASTAVMSFSSDVKVPEEKGVRKLPKKSSNAAAAAAVAEKKKKIIAPVVSKEPTKAAGQLVQQLKKSVAASLKKTSKQTTSAPVGKTQKLPTVSKGRTQASANGKVQKAAVAKKAPKAKVKPAAKSVAQPLVKRAGAKAARQVGKTSSKKSKSLNKPAKKTR